jgi:hypothetical protein
MPCDERKRESAFRLRPDLLTITTIPEVAHLVVGSTPGEFRGGRTFYDNPAYYLTDIYEIEGEDKSRFIRCNFHSTADYIKVGYAFCERFDTVICDHSVFQHFGTYDSVKSLFSMVKPGGSLIIDGATGLIRMNESKTRNQLIDEDIEVIKNKISDSLPGSKVDVYKCSDIILSNPVANNVYGPLISSNIISENTKCFVIVKPRAGGKRKRTVTRRKKNKKSRKLFH